MSPISFGGIIRNKMELRWHLLLAAAPFIEKEMQSSSAYARFAACNCWACGYEFVQAVQPLAASRLKSSSARDITRWM